MIQINKPEYLVENNSIIFSTIFEIDNRKDELWYKLSNKYKPFLNLETLDSFLVGLLFLGLKTGNDIHVKGMVSARLFYSLNHNVIPALCMSNPDYFKIKISADKLSRINFNEVGAGVTGLSCGVDSLATYYDSKSEDEGYGIQYFTFFNVGAHGEYGGGEARTLYKKRLNEVKGFAKEEEREIIAIDSNLSEILQMKFQQTYTLRIISCVLLLQKGIKIYYYASGTRFDHFSINNSEIADMDMLIVPNLSTESTQIYPSALQYTRFERTALISIESTTYRYLNVCVHSHLTTEKINCSECYKCMRTQLTLEVLNKLEDYQHVFDLSKYRKKKK